MSASMYGSPYTWKQPLPRIEYPPVFNFQRCSLKHFLDSKFLALAALLFFLAFVMTLFCVISPFWFKLVFNPVEGTFGTEAEKQKLSINTGLFFMNENEFDNLMELNKLNNHDIVPSSLALAQVFAVTGMCGLVACLTASIILVFRRFASVTANFFLAFFSGLVGLCLLMVFFFCLIMAMQSTCDPYNFGDKCNYEDNLVWRSIPVYSQKFRVEGKVTPLVKLNWTFYISLIGPILTIVGSALMWLEAIATYRNLSQIRYRQLRTARNAHDGEFNPYEHGNYVYKQPVMAGPMEYGMQPVVFQSGPYIAQPPQPQPTHSVGFDSYEPPSRRKSPPPPRRRSPSPSPSPSPPSTRRHSPPPSYRRRSPSPPSSRRRSPSPPSSRRRSPSPPSSRRRSPPPRRGPPSYSSSVSEGPYVSREIDL